MPNRTAALLAPTVPLGTSKPTADSFCSWLGGAMPGESFEYHRGFLAIDREPPEDQRKTPDHARVDQLANSILGFVGHGMVTLVQRRLAPNRFSYLAVKTTPRRVS